MSAPKRRHLASSSSSSSLSSGNQPVSATAFDNLRSGIKNCRRILVVIGAGVSTSSGVPDFRSPGGIYQQASSLLLVDDPEEVFHISQFVYDPKPFFSLLKRFLVAIQDANPTPTHKFLALLETKGILTRIISMNIDGLEKKAGLSQVLFCHGTLETAACLKCHREFSNSDYFPAILAEKLPLCPNCTQSSKKKSVESEDDEADPVLKPNIKFFGEKLAEDIQQQILSDVKSADLLLVVGTQLQTQPISSIPSLVPASALKILINRHPLPFFEGCFDYELLGECDLVSNFLWSMFDPEVSIPTIPTIVQDKKFPFRFSFTSFHSKVVNSFVTI